MPLLIVFWCIKSISVHSGCFNTYTYHHLIVAHFSEFF